jgi:AcrR family transcriptional regulator
MTSNKLARSPGRRTGRLSVNIKAQVPGRPATKDLLIATGEQFFGRFGINGVSLREIGVAAGQTNSNVVQYHFKDKRGLVIAIINDRMRRLEKMRGEHLDLLDVGGTQNARELLRVLWEPMASVRNAGGEHTFCRFLLQYMLQPQGPEHPSVGLAAYYRSRRIPPDLPQLARLQRLLRGQYKTLSMATFVLRMSALGKMFLSTIVEHDNARLLASPGKEREFDLEPILDLSIAALAAPVTEHSNRRSI